MPQEEAGRYVELMQVNADLMSKRRQLEWRIHFGLWLAIGAITAFACTQTPSDSRQTLAVWVGAAYAVSLVLYVWHSVGTCVSNEKDLAWLIYFQAMARQQLGESVTSMPGIPTVGDSDTAAIAAKYARKWLWLLKVPVYDMIYQWVYMSRQGLWHKSHGLIAHFILTLALMGASVAFIWNSQGQAAAP